MNIDTTRAALAYLSLAGLIIAGLLAFFVGDKLSSVQLTLLTMLLTQIAGKASSAFAYFFDGTPKPAQPDDTTPPTTERQP